MKKKIPLDCKRKFWVFFKSSIFAVLLAALFNSHISCKKSDISFSSDTTTSIVPESRKGQLLFSISPQQIKSGLKSTTTTPDLNSLMINIEDLSGQVIYNSFIIKTEKSGNNFIGKLSSVKAGNYVLTRFFTLDSYGSINYAVPLNNSTKSSLVSKALPILFSVKTNGITNIQPEIVEVNGSAPSDFGIPSAFQINQTFDILVSVMFYNSVSKNFELTNATITLSDKDGILFTQNLDPKTNDIKINGGLGNYTIKAEKTGFKTYTVSYSETELQTKFYNPLIIIMQP
jgi:hypothetical protein